MLIMWKKNVPSCAVHGRELRYRPNSGGGGEIRAQTAEKV